MVKNTNIIIDNIQYEINQIFVQIFDSLKISKKEFADQFGSDKSNMSTVLNYKRPLPPEWIIRLSKIHPQFDLHWLVTGIGQMLMSEKVSEKIQRIETNFNRNLVNFMTVMGYPATLIASRTNFPISYITSLVEGHLEADLDFLMILRKEFNVAIDDWLFEDFSNPNIMKALKETTAIPERNRELEDRIRKEVEEEMDKLRKEMIEKMKELEQKIKEKEG